MVIANIHDAENQLSTLIHRAVAGEPVGNPAHLPAELKPSAVRTPRGSGVGDRVGDVLTSNQMSILRLLRDNPRVAARELALQVGISRRKGETNLANFKQLGLIKRVGSARLGHWEVPQ
jgi:predicted HTH transcriptional regulator